MSAASEPAVKEAARAFADARAAAAHVGKAAKALKARAPDLVEETRRALKGRSRDARRQAGAAAALAESELQELRAYASEHAETLKSLLEDGFRGRPVTAVLAAAGAGFFLGVLLTGRRG
jgi:ElaB/YqjD/DUF883 family membrane-anchored ribosome-binding protein